MSFKKGTVAIIGHTNSGKSTLLNALFGKKVSIVTHKIQTTNRNIYATLFSDNYEISFVDTPGLHFFQNLTFKFHNLNIEKLSEDLDAIIFLVDANIKDHLCTSYLLPLFNKIKCTKILVLNKIDTLADNEGIYKKIAHFSKLFDWDLIVPISALKKKNLSSLINVILDNIGFGEKTEEQDTFEIQYLSEEYILQLFREKTLMFLNQEIPYGLKYSMNSLKNEPGKKVEISVNILVSKSSQKKIIIGKNGGKIKTIGTAVRKDLEKLSKRRIYLRTEIKNVKK